MLTALIDTADWLVAIPLQTLGDAPDFSGSRLTIALTPVKGGPPVSTASSDDGSLTFVSATSDTPAYFALDSYVEDRTWRVASPVKVAGDVLRHPDPGNPLRTEWLGRTELIIHPGSNSAGAAAASGVGSPILIPAEPYGNRITASPLVLGPQGAPAYPAFDPITDNGKSLKIVNGVPAWV